MSTPIYLIDRDDFIPYEDINVNIPVIKKLNPFILQAQFIDLVAIFGQEMYNDILQDSIGSPAYAKYDELVNGSTYEHNEHQYTHEGLVPVLCYFAHARYVLHKNLNDTAYGLVAKKNDYSEPVSDKSLIRLSDQSKSLAFAYMLPVIKYLDVHIEEFPLWKNHNYDCFCNGYNKYYPGTTHSFSGYSIIVSASRQTRITSIG